MILQVSRSLSEYWWNVSYPISQCSMGIKGSWNGGTVPYEAIFRWYIPLHSPYIGLLYGRYLQLRFPKWPLKCSQSHQESHESVQVPKSKIRVLRRPTGGWWNLYCSTPLTWDLNRFLWKWQVIKDISDVYIDIDIDIPSDLDIDSNLDLDI